VTGDPAGDPLTVRRATAGDVDALVVLVESAYRGEESRRGWTTEADLVAGRRTDHAEVARAVAGGDQVMLAAERAGRLVACCRLQLDGPGVAELGLFAVRPGLQGTGIGRAVVAAAEGEVQDRWACVTMRLLVISRRAELVAWYGRMGYRPTGRTAPFPASADIVPLDPELHFSVLEKALGRAGSDPPPGRDARA